MRKIALVLIVGMLAAGATFAQHSDDEVGIGAVFNFGGSSRGFLISPGVSFKLPNIPVFWGVAVNFYDGLWGPAITGDHHFFARNFRDEVVTGDDGRTYDLRLDWFAGVGGFANLLFGGPDNSPDFAFGLRIPAGMTWRVISWGEVALGMVPSLGLYVGHDGPAFHWSVSGELVLRYWFTPQARRGNGRENGRENRNRVNGQENGNGANGQENAAADNDTGNGEDA